MDVKDLVREAIREIEKDRLEISVGAPCSNRLLTLDCRPVQLATMALVVVVRHEIPNVCPTTLVRRSKATPIQWFAPTRPAFSSRLRWEAGMIAMWDNRLCVHQAYNDYQGHRRELYRTTIKGEKPV